MLFTYKMWKIWNVLIKKKMSKTVKICKSEYNSTETNFKFEPVWCFLVVCCFFNAIGLYLFIATAKYRTFIFHYKMFVYVSVKILSYPGHGYLKNVFSMATGFVVPWWHWTLPSRGLSCVCTLTHITDNVTMLLLYVTVAEKMQFWAWWRGSTEIPAGASIFPAFLIFSTTFKSDSMCNKVALRILINVM